MSKRAQGYDDYGSCQSLRRSPEHGNNDRVPPRIVICSKDLAVPLLGWLRWLSGKGRVDAALAFGFTRTRIMSFTNLS